MQQQERDFPSVSSYVKHVYSLVQGGAARARREQPTACRRVEARWDAEERVFVLDAEVGEEHRLAFGVSNAAWRALMAMPGGLDDLVFLLDNGGGMFSVLPAQSGVCFGVPTLTVVKGHGVVLQHADRQRGGATGGGRYVVVGQRVRAKGRGGVVVKASDGNQYMLTDLMIRVAAATGTAGGEFSGGVLAGATLQLPGPGFRAAFG